MTIPAPVIGLGSLCIAFYLTFLAPPGRRGRNAVLGGAFTVLTVFIAAYFLWPEDGSWNFIIAAAVASVIAVLVRDVRRWVRYFQNLSYRVRHPYYWYGIARRRFRRSRR